MKVTGSCQILIDHNVFLYKTDVTIEIIVQKENYVNVKGRISFNSFAPLPKFNDETLITVKLYEAENSVTKDETLIFNLYSIYQIEIGNLSSEVTMTGYLLRGDLSCINKSELKELMDK